MIFITVLGGVMRCLHDYCTAIHCAWLPALFQRLLKEPRGIPAFALIPLLHSPTTNPHPSHLHTLTLSSFFTSPAKTTTGDSHFGCCCLFLCLFLCAVLSFVCYKLEMEIFNKCNVLPIITMITNLNILLTLYYVSVDKANRLKICLAWVQL